MGHVHILQRNPDAAGTFPVQCLVTRTNCDTESDFYTPINPAMPSMFFEAPITLNREGDGAGPNGIAAVLVTDIHTSITAFDPMFMEQRVVTDLVPLNRMPGN
jgi:hypothetical protein